MFITNVSNFEAMSNPNRGNETRSNQVERRGRRCVLPKKKKKTHSGASSRIRNKGGGQAKQAAR
jgi:hypothetical protein